MKPQCFLCYDNIIGLIRFYENKPIDVGCYLFIDEVTKEIIKVEGTRPKIKELRHMIKFYDDEEGATTEEAPPASE